MLLLYRDWDSAGKLELVFNAESGELTNICRVDLATFLSQGEWLVCGLDNEVPRKTRAVYMSLTESGTFTYNITTGDGGGDSGIPATLPGIVRVDGAPADRQVVVLERPLDGEWRLAGFGPTPGGSGVIDVRVTDGSVYAVGVDDWGLAFTADLAVTAGQTIRPSQFSGWLYRITEGGTLPSTEPEWWAAVGENPSRLLGTARAIAVRYHQPLAHGPLPVEIT
ncbi:hypothetical protein [Phytopseudomonas dryadis]|uniref:Uncharacterized protein n=1 Tax=Phytopseudomonas dryadis TaxID=2487520 RepID=A0A4V6MX64_9GAMM|nr:hypothetical protein [Pseudomonas dryadis]TBU86792.1 hypothetical protein DNK44_22085 [Pseudomonas dryadis]